MHSAQHLSPYLETELQRLLEQEACWSWEMRQKILKAWSHCTLGVHEAQDMLQLNEEARDLSVNLGAWREKQLRAEIAAHVQALQAAQAVQAAQRMLQLVPGNAAWLGIPHAPTDVAQPTPGFLHQQFMHLMCLAGMAKEYVAGLVMSCKAVPVQRSTPQGEAAAWSACTLR